MNALFYPVHLCHARTLERLLSEYDRVHFRDFMALQLTPFMGTTAFPDRMGDYYPELLDTGRIIQGHNVSGALQPDMIAAVDRDLADPAWRAIFHDALSDDYQFQRTLFDEADIRKRENGDSLEIPVLSGFRTPDWQTTPFSVESVKALSRRSRPRHHNPGFEYGWALVKTSVALAYTIQLCRQLQGTAVTDSASHHRLLAQSCYRERIELSNSCLNREGY